MQRPCVGTLLFFFVSLYLFSFKPRIMQQIKEEMDIDHISFLGLFKERSPAERGHLD